MPVISAGLLVYRRIGELEVLLGRLGGPLWANRDHWTIPKGIVEDGEGQLAAAYREFREETGWEPPSGEPLALGEIRQRSGKRVVGWAVAGDFDPATFQPGTFTMEWPPHSGRIGEFPELGEVRWFSVAEAKGVINQAQIPLLERFEETLSA